MSRRKGPRTRRDCIHPQANHQHGTSLAYRYDRCRCEECTDVASAEALRVQRQRVYGRIVPVEWVDADQAREHVKEYMAEGYPLYAIAGASGLAVTKVRLLVYGLPSAGAAPTQRLRAADARAILAAGRPWRDMPDRALVPAVGAQRRVQALACIGWPSTHIAERVGTTQSHMSGLAKRRRITASMARAIADVYDELAMRPAPDGPYTRKLRTYAKKHGWAPPLAWDDETIDDPKTKPQGHALAA